jgi:hypothetical protein
MDKEIQLSYIPIRKSQMIYYKKVALYYKTGDNSFALYKPSGKMIAKDFCRHINEGLRHRYSFGECNGPETIGFCFHIQDSLKETNRRNFYNSIQRN